MSTFGLPQIWLDGSFVICCQGRLCHWLYLTKTKRIIRRVRTVSIIVFKGYAHTVFSVVSFFFVAFFGSTDKVGVCISIRGEGVEAW